LTLPLRLAQPAVRVKRYALALRAPFG